LELWPGRVKGNDRSPASRAAATRGSTGNLMALISEKECCEN
jgi:hypothetical protein